MVASTKSIAPMDELPDIIRVIIAYYCYYCYVQLLLLLCLLCMHMYNNIYILFIWIVKTLWQVFCSMLTQNRLYIRHAGRQEGQIVQWGVVFPTGCSNSNGVLTIKQLLRYMD
jgi:hypothetical protein